MTWSTRDLAGLALGVGTFVGTAALARRPIFRTEVQAFRTVNDLPGAGYPAIWLPMQYGTFGTVPVSAVLALARNRPRLALAIGIGGTTAWVSAKALKRLVGRGRPANVIDDVFLRGVEEGDLGFPSGRAVGDGRSRRFRVSCPWLGCTSEPTSRSTWSVVPLSVWRSAAPSTC